MRGLRAAAAAALALLTLVVLAAPASAEVPERWDTLSREIAAAWPDQQGSNGRFRDYTDRFFGSEYAYTRYGDAMLGYALIQTGVRDREPELVRSGLRGIGWVLRRPKNFHKRGSVFEYMAMAGAYNLARKELSGDDDFRSLRGRWESWLRGLRPISTIYRRPGTSRYSNHYLVEAIAILELQRSGLRSSRSGAILGGKRGSPAGSPGACSTAPFPPWRPPTSSGSGDSEPSSSQTRPTSRSPTTGSRPASTPGRSICSAAPPTTARGGPCATSPTPRSSSPPPTATSPTSGAANRTCGRSPRPLWAPSRPPGCPAREPAATRSSAR
ncbi:MAG: hypothetical protein WKF40_06175 [Thermoleophilaceae bacterium]